MTTKRTYVAAACLGCCIGALHSAPVHASLVEDGEWFEYGPHAAASRTVDSRGERSVLTPAGTLVIEPSLQYIDSTATEVAIEGYTVIPAVAIGLFNVSQVQRDALTAAMGVRYGAGPRLELEVRIPYVYKQESVREREVFDGSRVDIIRASSGRGAGDVEAAVHYQFNRTNDGPFFVGNLRLKSATGEGPFDVQRQVLYDSDGNEIGEVLREQPTGSGFNAVQPSLNMVYPTDPAVIYANLSYLWNVKRNVPTFGTIDPGDALGVNIGMGFSVNDRTAFSLGYDHSVVFKTEIDNVARIAPTFERFHVGTLLLGLSQRLSARRSIHLNLGVGVTSTAPNVQMTLRLPVILRNPPVI